MESSIGRRALEQVALIHNVSVEEVVREIENACAKTNERSLSPCAVSAPEIVERLARLVLERM